MVKYIVNGNKDVIGKEVEICGVKHLMSMLEWVIYPDDTVLSITSGYTVQSGIQPLPFLTVDGYEPTDEFEFDTKFTFFDEVRELYQGNWVTPRKITRVYLRYDAKGTKGVSYQLDGREVKDECDLVECENADKSRD